MMEQKTSAKIRDPDMRELAASGADTPVSVLIALDGPQPTSTPVRSRLTPDRIGFVFTPASDTSFGPVFRAFEGFLQKIGAKSHGLPSANAYAATLPASALREVAAHPLVTAVDVNSMR